MRFFLQPFVCRKVWRWSGTIHTCVYLWDTNVYVADKNIYTTNSKLSVEHFNNVNFFLQVYFRVFLLFVFLHFFIILCVSFLLFLWLWIWLFYATIFISAYKRKKKNVKKAKKKEKSKRISHLYRKYYYNHYIFTICCDALFGICSASCLGVYCIDVCNNSHRRRLHHPCSHDDDQHTSR